jgi:hypothetical protein
MKTYVGKKAKTANSTFVRRAGRTAELSPYAKSFTCVTQVKLSEDQL